MHNFRPIDLQLAPPVPGELMKAAKVRVAEALAAATKVGRVVGVVSSRLLGTCRDFNHCELKLADENITCLVHI